MTKTEQNRRNRVARDMYAKGCRILRMEPTKGWQKAGEAKLKSDLQGKFIACRNHRRRRKCLRVAFGLTRKKARESERVMN